MIFTILGASLIGLSLGLLGSGGSILTVPMLVYVVGQDEKLAVCGSLAIVGTVSMSASLSYAWRKQVDWRSVLSFGIPGMLGTTIGAGLSGFMSGTVQLILFGFVMLAASVFMLRRGKPETGNAESRKVWKIALDGLGVGMLTGLVGVGGGFLVVPALVVIGGLPMRTAVGTSLMVITMNSWTGFVGHLRVLDGLGLSLDWAILGTFAGIGVLGSFVGQAVAGRISQQHLRRVFGVLLVVMAGFILVKELSR